MSSRNRIIAFAVLALACVAGVAVAVVAGIAQSDGSGETSTTARRALSDAGAAGRTVVVFRALKAGRPGFAAVDVYGKEPIIGADHPLLKMDNATCTPHLGYVTREAYEQYYGFVVDHIVAFAAGKPTNIVNPEVLEKK